MHAMTRAVAEEATALEFRQFQYPDQRERLMEIRALALQQVRDDSNSMAAHRRGSVERIGREWVGHDNPDNGVGLWRRWSARQMRLADRMQPLIGELTTGQREAIYLLFERRFPERVAADILGIHRKTLYERREGALAKLRKRITELYLPPAEEAA